MRAGNVPNVITQKAQKRARNMAIRNAGLDQSRHQDAMSYGSWDTKSDLTRRAPLDWQHEPAKNNTQEITRSGEGDTTVVSRRVAAFWESRK